VGEVNVDRTLRIGVIGLRRGEGLAAACRAVGGAEVTALYDIDAAVVTDLASALGATPFTELDAFLASDIDIVAVASPIPNHAGQSIAALNAGKHVLCEVTACETVDEARAVVAAANAAPGIFMLAENCNYYDEIEVVKRFADAGRFGQIYYGEGDYVHDLEGLWYDTSGSRTWRGAGHMGVYGTHGLGPLLYITGDRVATVRAIGVAPEVVRPDLRFPTMHLVEMTTVSGAVFRTRVDIISPRPLESTTFFLIQGQNGSYESARGFGDRAKYWLRDEHGVSDNNHASAWRPLQDEYERIIPERANAVAVTGGHGTAEFWMLRDFFGAICEGRPSPIDQHRGFDISLPCIVAVESARLGGVVIDVPDTRLW
jgi:predicted dehydrogenase